jgi:hypothetical protein
MTKDFCVCSVGKTQQPGLSCNFHLVKQDFSSIWSGRRNHFSRSLLAEFSNQLQDPIKLLLLGFAFSNKQASYIGRAEA